MKVIVTHQATVGATLQEIIRVAKKRGWPDHTEVSLTQLRATHPTGFTNKDIKHRVLETDTELTLFVFEIPGYRS